MNEAQMIAYYKSLVKQGKISKDRQLAINPPVHTDSLIEQLFYAYMEHLENEHKND